MPKLMYVKSDLLLTTFSSAYNESNTTFTHDASSVRQNGLGWDDAVILDQLEEAFLS